MTGEGIWIHMFEPQRRADNKVVAKRLPNRPSLNRIKQNIMFLFCVEFKQSLSIICEKAS
jgi:hypothetical protein